MASNLPTFQAFTLDELRAIWVTHKDPEIRRLVIEVERYRRVIAEIDGLYKATHAAWYQTQGGNLVALHRLQKIMTVERERLIR